MVHVSYEKYSIQETEVRPAARRRRSPCPIRVQRGSANFTRKDSAVIVSHTCTNYEPFFEILRDNVNDLGSKSPPAAGGANAIATKLRGAIVEGRYTYRERMPSERALAQQFGVARGTIRSALRQLEDMNLVSRRASSGSFVCYRGYADHEDIAELTSPLELIEVRIAIEPAMARLAVINANAQDIERMGESLRRLEEGGSDPESFSDNDELFHMALAQGARNPLMLWLYRHINEVRGHAQWSARKDKVLTPQKIKQYNQQHRALFTAITRRDVEEAEKIIRKHLAQAKADLLGQ